MARAGGPGSAGGGDRGRGGACPRRSGPDPRATAGALFRAALLPRTNRPPVRGWPSPCARGGRRPSRRPGAPRVRRHPGRCGARVGRDGRCRGAAGGGRGRGAPDPRALGRRAGRLRGRAVPRRGRAAPVDRGRRRRGHPRADRAHRDARLGRDGPSRRGAAGRAHPARSPVGGHPGPRHARAGGTSHDGAGLGPARGDARRA